MLVQKLMLAWSLVIFEELFRLFSMSFLLFVAQVRMLNGKLQKTIVLDMDLKKNQVNGS
jgi:hypothetical protein